MKKTYHDFYDALGRVHIYYGTDAEAKAVSGPFSAWGVSMGTAPAHAACMALCLDTSSSYCWDVSAMIDDDDIPTGFVYGPALVALTAASKATEFKHWMPDDERDFRPQYLCWVAQHIGSCIPSSIFSNKQFHDIVATVLKKKEHPAYAAAVAAHEEKWVPPTEVDDYSFWMATYP